ncbi:hypothetical protein B0H10DRAFT_2000564 [Mycena sp. CBHHK59/15]|nr:hypothetical protein B0H10DRAFT_2000564 [Mycena sp. CBHHK59/15]
MTSVEYRVNSDSSFLRDALSAKPNSLVVLSSRIKRRLALRRIHFAPELDCSSPDDALDGESEGEDGSSDSESSTSDGTPKPTGTRRHTSRPYCWNRPSIELMDLPVEIIEHITVSLRGPKSSLMMDSAALYISEKYSEFSQARFSLSALSRVCSVLRNVVERILYRNVQLDFTGWKGRKHPRWPAGSLRLLLRTLEGRPELGRYIHTAALDYQLSTKSEALEKGLEDFLAQTPNLTHLFLSQCPVALWGFPTKNIAGFATTFAPGILPSLLGDLPALKELHLRDCHIMALTGGLPSHNLQRIRLDSSHENASGHFTRVLAICEDSVHDLDIRFIGGLLLPAPLFFGETLGRPSGGGSLRTLRLDNISVLSHVNSAYAHLLRDLPVLQHLHVSHHAAFAPSAFDVLPASLLSLTASSYYGLWTYAEPAQDGFMVSLARCISMSTKEVARVEASDGDGKGKGKEDRFVLDLQPVVVACKTERTVFIKVEAAHAFVTIFCMSVSLHSGSSLTRVQSEPRVLLQMIVTTNSRRMKALRKTRR